MNQLHQPRTTEHKSDHMVDVIVSELQAMLMVEDLIAGDVCFYQFWGVGAGPVLGVHPQAQNLFVRVFNLIITAP